MESRSNWKLISETHGRFCRELKHLLQDVAEISSSLANRLLLPAGPKSMTEEDLGWMYYDEHCRKNGGKPKTSRNFGIF